jgi:hypothetical protein
MEVAVAVFSPLLDVLADVPDPRRAEGKLYKLPHVLLFSILAIVAGCNSYRGVERRRSPDIVTFVDVHRRRLNAAFGLIPTAFNFDLRRWWATGEITGQS